MMRLKTGRIFGFVGGACSLIATAAIFVLPMYEGILITVNWRGKRTEEHVRKTLLEAQPLEPIALFFFAAVIALSLVALLDGAHADSRRDDIAMLAAGLLLLCAAFISGFGIGAYYLPGVVMVFIAGILMSLRHTPK